MLGQELENVVADEVLAAAVGDAEDVGDAGGVKADGERIVGYDQVLYTGLSAQLGGMNRGADSEDIGMHTFE